MRYLYFVISSFFISAILYCSLVFFLYPAPIVAEYWIREMMVIKRTLALPFVGQNKIIIAAGSNALFSIDTNMIAQVFKRPALNFGLTAGLPLTSILREVDKVTEKGDIVILPLEPDYYCRENDKYYQEWQYRNAVAWYTDLWQAMSIREHLAALSYIDPLFPIEMLKARIAEVIKPSSISQRLNALDDQAILKKYTQPKDVSEPIYSIYNIDSLGNIKNTADSSYSGTPRQADAPIRICVNTTNTLRDFVQKMKQKGVTIYVAHTPYVETEGLDRRAVQKASDEFNEALSTFVVVLDSKADLIFKRSLFLDSDMHLNTVGREQRTKILIKDLLKKMDQEGKEHRSPSQ